MISYLTRNNMINKYKKAVLEIVNIEKPDIIHAHSSYLNGMAANYASRRTGVPSIYELRSLWGESAIVNEGLKRNSWRHRLLWKLELGVMKKASRIVSISKGIKEEIVARGILGNKIDIVSNGVDTNYFSPRSPDLKLISTLNLENKFVIGYIGSIRKLEGLELLVNAFVKGKFKEKGCCLLIVGDGPEKHKLQEISKEHKLEDSIVFTGNVPHSQILNYYSVIDLFVYPRVDALINQRVTPLKPLEVMAMEKISLGSDVGGLKELIIDEGNGFLFEAGNIDNLIDKIDTILEKKSNMDTIGRKARKWVIENREWSKLINLYKPIYEKTCMS